MLELLAASAPHRRTRWQMKAERLQLTMAPQSRPNLRLPRWGNDNRALGITIRESCDIIVGELGIMAGSGRLFAPQ